MPVVVIALGDDKKCWWCRGAKRFTEGNVVETCEFCAGTGLEGIAVITSGTPIRDEPDYPPAQTWIPKDV